MRYFTADLHLFHAGIIPLCFRPFSSVAHMHSVILSNWNSKVTDDDTVFIVGDLGLTKDGYVGGISKFVDRANGHKILILGNHDNLDPFTYVGMGIDSVHTSFDISIDTDPEAEYVTLTHDPARAYEIPSRIHLCGHVHGLFDRCKNAINVGVDVRGFSPVSEDELVKIMKEIRRGQ